MAAVDTMYQYSLEAYINIFKQSLEQSPTAEDQAERIRQLNDFHTMHVYRTTCRGLFEKHKLLFSFQLCTKIMDSEKKLNKERNN